MYFYLGCQVKERKGKEKEIRKPKLWEWRKKKKKGKWDMEYLEHNKLMKEVRYGLWGKSTLYLELIIWYYALIKVIKKLLTPQLNYYYR